MNLFNHYIVYLKLIKHCVNYSRINILKNFKILKNGKEFSKIYLVQNLTTIIPKHSRSYRFLTVAKRRKKDPKKASKSVGSKFNLKLKCEFPIFQKWGKMTP